MRIFAVVLAALLCACVSRRTSGAPDLVGVANGAGEKCYNAVRAALEPQGITPHCLGSIGFGISVDARDAARARAILKPLCADPDLYLILAPYRP